MKKFRIIKYFKGRRAIADMGIIDAETSEEALEKANLKFPNSFRLTANEDNPDKFEDLDVKLTFTNEH